MYKDDVGAIYHIIYIQLWHNVYQGFLNVVRVPLGVPTLNFLRATSLAEKL